MLLKEGKKGQVTIFIIVAILVIAIGVLIYFFYPKIRGGISSETKNPHAFIQECIEEDIEDAVEKLSLQGGSVAPERYILYYGNEVEYLCYTINPSEQCVVQQPLLIQHIESEILNEISEEVEFCFDSLRESYEGKGYNVGMIPGDTKVELLPKRIVTNFGYNVTLTNGDSEKYDSFSVVLDNNLYELASIANSIIQYETEFGKVDTSIYMTYYHDLKVWHEEQTDGTTIYVLTDKNNGKKFQFASRSVVIPPGYF